MLQERDFVPPRDHSSSDIVSLCAVSFLLCSLSLTVNSSLFSARHRIPFIFTSTSLVLEPDAYGSMKRLGESWVKALKIGKIVRLWNVYSQSSETARHARQTITRGWNIIAHIANSFFWYFVLFLFWSPLIPFSPIFCSFLETPSRLVWRVTSSLIGRTHAQRKERWRHSPMEQSDDRLENNQRNVITGGRGEGRHCVNMPSHWRTSCFSR